MSKIIDCLRCRKLDPVTIRAECVPEPEDCGACQPTPCVEELKQAKRALEALASGSAVQEISEGDRRVRYFHTVANMERLELKISRLEMKCGQGNSVSSVECGSIRDTFFRDRPPPILVLNNRFRKSDGY